MVELRKETHWPLDVILNDKEYAWISINPGSFDWHFREYNRIVEHCLATNPEEIYWNKIGDCIYCRFIREEDYLFFVLKFGPGDRLE